MQGESAEFELIVRNRSPTLEDWPYKLYVEPTSYRGLLWQVGGKPWPGVWETPVINGNPAEGPTEYRIVVKVTRSDVAFAGDDEQQGIVIQAVSSCEWDLNVGPGLYKPDTTSPDPLQWAGTSAIIGEAVTLNVRFPPRAPQRRSAHDHVAGNHTDAPATTSVAAVTMAAADEPATPAPCFARPPAAGVTSFPMWFVFLAAAGTLALACVVGLVFHHLAAMTTQLQASAAPKQ